MALVDTGTVESDELRISNATPGDFYRLMKPRVMYLVIFTAFVGMVLAPTHINPLLSAISLLCIAVGAGASGALNMWYEADIDAQMTRTAGRPIPTGAVTREEALVFALVLVVISVMTLGLVSNWMAAAFLGFTIFFYAVPYTMYLKMATPQNIVIGGAAGAFPPMVAWTAMTGTISLESAVLFAIIFLWTPPHFWALALFKLKDYETVGMPMMPNVAGEKSTRRQMFVYSIILAVAGILPTVLGFAGLIYGIVAVLLGARFVQLSWVVLRNNGCDNMQAERKLFVFSIYYLFILFAALLIEPAIDLARGLLGV